MNKTEEIEFNCLLTKEEFFKLAEAVRRDGELDETEVERLTDWAMKHITQAEIAKLMIDGFLLVRGWDEDGNPLVEPTHTAVFVMNRIAEGKALEEMVCG